MTRLPVLTPKQLIRVLKKAGYYIDHQTGSHVILYKDDKSPPVAIPFHTKDLKKGTLRNILKYCNISPNELNKYLSK